MTVQEVWNRGNNLVATAIVGLAGVAFFPEAFVEDKFHYKADDAELFIVGMGAFIWYIFRNNKYKRSILPMLFVSLSFVFKLAGFFMEFKDKDDLGDDIGGVILFLLATIFVWSLYYMTPKILKKITK